MLLCDFITADSIPRNIPGAAFGRNQIKARIPKQIQIPNLEIKNTLQQLKSKRLTVALIKKHVEKEKLMDSSTN